MVDLKYKLTIFLSWDKVQTLKCDVKNLHDLALTGHSLYILDAPAI